MKASQVPSKFLMPFGSNAAAGTIRPIPQASQAATNPGAASLYDGFPTITGQPLASGGIPPSMQDFNGVLLQDTSWAWWQGAGGTVLFDSAFATAVGGYPAGALLGSTTAGQMWLNTADNNTTDPDSASASGWLAVITKAALDNRNIIGSNSISFGSPGTTNWTVPTGVTRVRVRVWGAGGGGAGGAMAAGAGGGYSYGVYTVTPGQVISIVVGAGGAGTTGSTNGTNPGAAGGSSSFGSFCSATGGQGGGNGSTAGGTGSGGQINQSGSGGQDLDGYTTFAVGGASPFGGGSAPYQGIFPGGGGGASATNSGVGAQGYAGSAGCVIVDY